MNPGAPHPLSSASVPPRSQVRKAVPNWVFALLWLSLVPLLIGPNPGLTLVGGLVASLLPGLLWRRGEAPTLLWICFYQWVQAFVPVVKAGLEGMPVAASFGGAEFEDAVLFSLLGVFLFSMGAALASRIVIKPKMVDSPVGLQALSAPRLFTVWLTLAVSAPIVQRLLLGSGLLQLVQPLSYLYLAAMLLLFQYALATGRGWVFAGVLGVVEICIGLFGYFGGFKTVLFMFALGALSFAARRQRVWAQAVGIMLLAALLGNFWQATKSEYRSFVVDGGDEVDQVTRVAILERVNYMGRALESMTWDQYVLAFGNTLERISYVTFFGHCLRNVPSSVPHAEGRLWKEALIHVLMPRILFPNKQSFNDSDRTNEFTGLQVADASQGTSIGIGYVGESYVDFGVPAMFIPILLFGAAVGGGYALLVRLAPLPLLGAAFGTAMLMRSGFLLESSNAKMLGGLVITTVIYAFMLKFLGGPIWRWLAPAARPVGAPDDSSAGPAKEPSVRPFSS